MRLADLAVVALVCACEGKRAASTGIDLPPLRPVLEAAPAPSSQGATGTEPSVEPIAFDWGAPCSVPAVQDVDNDGKRVRFAFDVMLVRRGAGYVMTLENLRAVSTVASPVALEQAVQAVDGAIPPVLVNADGASDGATDIDRAIDAVIKIATRQNATTAAQVERFLRSPQFRAAFEQKAAETWNSWVGAFAGEDIAPYTVRRSKIDLPTAMGTLKDVAVTVTHQGFVRDAPTLALISTEQSIEGPELGRMLAGLFKDVVPAGAVPKFEHARKTDKITVAIDPRLGRPHRVVHVMSIELDGRRKQRSRDTAFDWSHSRGCVPQSNTGSASSTE